MSDSHVASDHEPIPLTFDEAVISIQSAERRIAMLDEPITRINAKYKDDIRASVRERLPYAPQCPSRSEMSAVLNIFDTFSSEVVAPEVVVAACRVLVAMTRPNHNMIWADCKRKIDASEWNATVHAEVRNFCEKMRPEIDAYFQRRRPRPVIGEDAESNPETAASSNHDVSDTEVPSAARPRQRMR